MSESWRERQERYPWLKGLPEKLPPRVPEPVPEFGWCARCKRVNPQPGDPRDHDGHDWVVGLDQYAYVAGVICPECLAPEERQKVDAAALDLMVYGDDSKMDEFDTSVFINPEDAEDDA